MPDVEEVVEGVASARTWDDRVAQIRRVPEEFGRARRQEVYAAIAARVYAPQLAPDFAYIHWRSEYGLAEVERAYNRAVALTDGFTKVEAPRLAEVIQTEPRTLRIFRLLLGFTTQEFAACTELVAETEGGQPVGNSQVKSMEAGSRTTESVARSCAAVVDKVMQGELFEAPEGELLRKTEKPDTAEGWETVRRFAQEGVPLAAFLHQRHYGGAFRQLLDATSVRRGNILEEAVEDVFTARGVPHLRTGSQNQEEIESRFGITVKPAPDFVVFDGREVLRAMLECKGANDGGTARDKAARFRSLKTESTRLGGVPLFAVLSGLGWSRASDALGPVVRDTDGRTFAIPALGEMLTVDPFPQLVRTAAQ